MENNNDRNELDLLDIIKICWGWFLQFVFNPAAYLLRFIIKSWKQLACFAILGVVASIGYWRLFPNYQTIAVYECHVGNSSDYIIRLNMENIASLENKVKDFNVPENVISQVKIFPHYIYYYDTISYDIHVDMDDAYLANRNNKVFDGNRFCVEFVSWDEASLQNIELSVLNMFCKNEYDISKNEQRLSKLQSQVDFAISESNVLDSLRSANFKMSSGIDVLKLSEEGVLSSSNIMSYSKELMKLHNMKVYSDNQLKYNNDIMHLVHVSHPDNPKNFFLLTIKQFTCIALFFGFLILLCWHFRGNIKSFLKKQ